MENPKALVSPEAGLTASAEDDNSFGQILSQFERQHAADSQQTIDGAVVSIGPDAIFVDIGRKMDGILTLEHFREANGDLEIHVGDKLKVSISGRDADGAYQLSTFKVARPKDWSGFEKAFAEKTIVAGTVSEIVKGGLRVDVGVPAFLPASRSGAREQAGLEKLIGQQIECRIIKLDVADEDIVLDRRAVLEERALSAKQAAFGHLKEGEVLRGTVRSLTDFGAFVEIAPGIDGLLHVADMAWVRVGKPSDVVKIGDAFDVKILKINAETRRISLGLKQLVPDPWTLAGERFQVGDRVQGKVSRLTDYGAFVEIAPGVDGLIHVSEMSWSKKVRKPADVVNPGDMVEAVILAVNPAEHRVSLGLKQALGDPWEEAGRKYPPGAIVEGAVTSIQQFGAFVDLGNGIDGMIHIGDISREKRLNHPREMLTVGKTVKAVVLEQDKERRRIRLGMKQLEPGSVDQFIAGHHVGDLITGRVVDVTGSRVKAELGEGVFAVCRLPAPPPERSAAVEQPTGAGKTDLSSMTAMLSAKWKKGGSPGAEAVPDRVQAGQVRSFRITAVDPSKKSIEAEIAG